MKKNKPYTVDEPDSVCVEEPAVAYQLTTAWDPNVPFSGTQEDWWEHFMQIEKGQFYSLEQANRKFDVWKKDYLAKKLS